MPHAERNGERLYFETRGRGPKLVLVRGLSRSMRFWPADFLEQLARRFELLLFDHRGIGRSELSNPKFTIADMADDLAAVMDASGFERAHVFGISLGGMVSQHLALRHPEKIDQLILAATLTAPKAMQARYGMFVPLIFGSRLNNLRGMQMQLRVLTTPSFARKNKIIAERWLDLLRDEPINGRAVVGQMRAALGNDTREQAAHVPHNTLVITGNADRLIPMKSSEWLARTLPNARLRVLDGVGHEIPAQAPAATTEAITEFLS
jgi:pimeloyl-ACP methyl ester carboxylesterase